MIWAVIDTNILIRAFIKPQGTVGPILQRVRDGSFVLIYSGALLDELLATLVLPSIRDKYRICDEAIEALVALLVLRGEIVAPHRRIRICRDAGDDMVIEAALAGNASHVVTGDKDLLVVGQYEGVSFVEPRAFLELIA